MLDTTTSLEDVLYPPIEAHEQGRLKVTELHTIAWERSGNPDGIPVIVIHGGPGGGGQPSYRQYFDPAAFDIIQFDQRGCGQSTLSARLRNQVPGEIPRREPLKVIQIHTDTRS